MSICRYRFSPVAAGISLPMMTFSFSPSRRSILPSIQEVGRSDRALVERVARLDPLALRDQEPGAARHGVRAVVLLVSAVGHDRDLDLALRLLEVDDARDLGELCRALRVAGLEDLDDS